MPYKEEGYSDKEIFKVALQKGATRKNLSVIAHRVVTKPDYSIPEIDDDYEIE